MRHGKRPGFSVNDLVVLLALVLLLFLMMLPATVRARQVALRTQSFNNLRQFGIAVHSYHDTHAAFCAGCDDNNFSAHAHLLPFFEQEQEGAGLDLTKELTHKDNAKGRKARIAVFLSPTDPRKQVNDDLGATNYVFSAGSKPALKDNDGLFFLNSAVKLEDVTDGMSNTIMCAETLKGDGGTKAVSVRRQHIALDGKDDLKELKEESGVKEFKDDKNIAGDRCASWADGRFLQTTYTATRLPNDDKPDVNCNGKGGLSAIRSLDGKFSLLFADGSVRSLSKKIKLDAWKDLHNIADGNMVDLPA